MSRPLSAAERCRRSDRERDGDAMGEDGMSARWGAPAPPGGSGAVPGGAIEGGTSVGSIMPSDDQMDSMDI